MRSKGNDIPSDPGICAIVALKSFKSAKSRLRPHLSEAERRALIFFMARRTLSALRATHGIADVRVVTACDEVESLAVQMGAEVIRQTEDQGTAAAFAHATAALMYGERKPARLLMIAGDLPLISPTELSRLVNQSAAKTGVCIVPDRKRIGTNALLCSPPNAIPPCFGANSFREHLAAAREKDIAVQVIESEALSLDIDVADDLALLCSLSGLKPDSELRELLAALRKVTAPASPKTEHNANAA